MGGKGKGDLFLGFFGVFFFFADGADGHVYEAHEVRQGKARQGEEYSTVL